MDRTESEKLKSRFAPKIKQTSGAGRPAYSIIQLLHFLGLSLGTKNGNFCDRGREANLNSAQGWLQCNGLTGSIVVVTHAHGRSTDDNLTQILGGSLCACAPTGLAWPGNVNSKTTLKIPSTRLFFSKLKGFFDLRGS